MRPSGKASLHLCPLTAAFSFKYTLNDGVTDYTHRFIKPDAIPTGYTSSCLEHAKETHEIPLKDFGLATHDYRSIYQQLKSFLTPTAINQPTAHLTNDDRARRRYLRSSRPCVFFPSYEYQQTSELLDWLQEKAEGKFPSLCSSILTRTVQEENQQTKLVSLISQAWNL